MSIELRRRQFLGATLAAAGSMTAGLTLPGAVMAATMGRGFTHGVASGEPAADAILLWTRYVGAAGASDTRLTVELAEDAEFGRVVASGEATSSEASGHCAKAVLSGLSPATWYFYRFRAPGGETSVVGRTRTLPAAGTDPFAMAVMSCSNLPFGYFNAYAHAAMRNDLHLAVHLGDYFYEYAAGTYPAADQKIAGRDVDPAHEIVSMDDYHRRYAVYRADPDLRRLHQVLPMVSIWDDHEITNDAWEGGAENHQPDTEGDWDLRKATAKAAYRHWMPVSDEPYKAYRIGDLATLFRLDTRIEGRDEQVDVARVFAEAGSFAAAVTRLKDADWGDSARTMMGMRQEAWLKEALASSVSSGQRWQVLAQQVVMGTTYTPSAIGAWLDPAAPDYVKQRVNAALGLSQAGIPASMDAWTGYPAARSRLLTDAQAVDANLVVLAGDSHNSWAFNLTENGAPAGVEFAVSSVTSPGYEAFFTRTDPAVIESAMIGSSPELQWTDLSRRGYGVVTLEAEQARCDWTYVDTIKTRSLTAKPGKRLSVQRGANVLT
ncbi:alkaline phosphatase D family protein [Pacificimonas sp. WHA3]|uniref:Alkaline phosphatase D family protein n=1 Tax=Pacificimonas pallii TaxID=2827236 RepID=A0ABS6SIG8_9SPHN|nr:alkaline phosphatase D family protein [Pacificimonas pallii]MBV7257726.1 alkaline phosphatase D family protein [Pacificimonas pallii]